MSVVLTLLVVWTAVLVPPALRARSQARAEFNDSFRRHLDGLERRAAAAQGTAVLHRQVSEPGVRPGFVPVPPAIRSSAPRTSQARRRRMILAMLLTAMGASLVAGVHPEARFLWAVHLFLDDIFLGYVALLVHGRQRAERTAPAGFAVPLREPERPRPSGRGGPRPVPVGIGASVLAARQVPATLGPAAVRSSRLARRLAGAGS